MSFIVFRIRSPGMPEGKLQRLVEVYFKGRDMYTMKSYESSFRKLGGLCRECDLSVFGLDEGARCLLTGWRQETVRSLQPA